MSAEVGLDFLIDQWLSAPPVDTIVKYESRSWAYIRNHPICKYLPDYILHRLENNFKNNLKNALNRYLSSDEIDSTAKECQTDLSLRYIDICSKHAFNFLGDSQIPYLYEIECLPLLNPDNIEPADMAKKSSVSKTLYRDKLRDWPKSRTLETAQKIQNIVKANVSQVLNHSRRYKQFHFLALALAEKFDDKEINQIHENLFSPLGKKRQNIYKAVCVQTLHELEEATLILVGRVAYAISQYDAFFKLHQEDEIQKAVKIRSFFQIAPTLTHPLLEEIKKSLEIIRNI